MDATGNFETLSNLGEDSEVAAAKVQKICESEGCTDAITSRPQWKSTSLKVEKRLQDLAPTKCTFRSVSYGCNRASGASEWLVSQGEAQWRNLYPPTSANQAEQIVYTKWTKAAGAVLMLSLLPQQCCSVWFQLGEYHVRCWTCLSCEIAQPRKSGNISAKKLMAGPDTASVEPPSAQFVAAPLSFTCQQVWDRTKRRAHLGKSIGQGPSSHGNRLMQPFSDNTRGCFHSYACVTGSCQKQKGFPQ